MTCTKQEEQSTALDLHATASNSPSPDPQRSPNNNHSPHPPEPAFTQHSSPSYSDFFSFQPCKPPLIVSNSLEPSLIEKPVILPVASTSLTSTKRAKSSTLRHIPRPANAFILFRLRLMNSGLIPDHIKSCQKSVSSIAGQVWRVLTPAQKAIWYAQAAATSSQHRQENPDYKFTPAPRGSRGTKKRSQGKPNSIKPGKTRDPKEKYLNITRPSPRSAQKGRRQKTTPFDVSRIDQSPSLTSYCPMTGFPEPSILDCPTPSPPKPNDTSYGSPNLEIDFTRSPSTASSASESEFFDYIQTHGAELFLAINQIGSVSAPSSSPSPSYDNAMWTPYSAADTSTSLEPIVPGIVGYTGHEDLSSLSFFESVPVNDPYSFTTAPVTDATWSENTNNYYHPVDLAPFTSYGFTEDFIASLAPTSEDMQVPLGESTSHMWLPSGTSNLEGWDFNNNFMFSSTLGQH